MGGGLLCEAQLKNEREEDGAALREGQILGRFQMPNFGRYLKTFEIIH